MESLSPAISHSGRWLRRARRIVTHGLGDAAVRFYMSAPEPLDPDFTWRYFTRKQPRLIQKLIDGYPLRFQRRWLMRRWMNQSHAEGIEYHYDVSNDFYKLFLDRDFMFYSCADFEKGDKLETAQRRKADHLLSLIQPKAGERILELGSGWGGMLRHISEATGDKQSLEGTTLSQEQARYVQEKYGFNVRIEDFITRNYEPESYDKIYSIGSMEHVRPEEILPLLRKLHGALKPDGRIVNHFFSLNGEEEEPTSMIAGQLIFPGSTLAAHSRHLRAAREAGFDVIHDSLHDYRPTLKAWFNRLAKNRDKALELVGLENYNRYLIFFAAAWVMFDQGQCTLHRLVLVKRKNG